MIEIADKRAAQPGFLTRLLQPHRLKNTMLLLLVWALLATFVLVRKRQLLRRVLGSVFRLLQRLVLQRGQLLEH